jgi:O-methyltransferase involved in polyketide biosynthesis
VTIDRHPNRPDHDPGLSQLCLPRLAVRALAACASSEELCPELGLRDTAAAGLFEELGGDTSIFTMGELRCAAFRASVVDQLTLGFFERQPDATGVGIWPLLGTRGHRLARGRWVDVDAPQIAELRARFLPRRAGWQQLSACLCSAACVDFGRSGDQRALYVMDESVLPLSSDVMMRVLDTISRRAAPGSEVVLAFDARAPLREASPFRRRSALELLLQVPAQSAAIARYPRLRFVDSETYGEGLRTSLDGVNGVARLQHGLGAPAVAHLEVI